MWFNAREREALGSMFGVRWGCSMFSGQTPNTEHRTPNAARRASKIEFETGGGGGIRTHEAFRPAGFQDRSHQPLDHPSRRVTVLPLFVTVKTNAVCPVFPGPMMATGSADCGTLTLSNRYSDAG
jgi:hypothetical protein